MSTNTNFTPNIQVLNIATNMGRIGGWTFDSYDAKRKLITRFLDETDIFVRDLENEKISEKFRPTLEMFKKEFYRLKSEEVNQENKLAWAERALTWANILTHRAKLA